MQEKTKQKEKTDEENSKTIEKEEESEILKDQTERGYYYDDACGYEIYIEEDLEDEN